MKHSNSVYCVVFTDPFHFLIDFYSNTKKTICLITKSNAHKIAKFSPAHSTVFLLKKNSK